uniref:Contactin associated protein-like 5b n=1 Tax=Scleropages formosus TaxID=113540 RepID=A0A8C9S2G3_SCLFO
LTKGRAIRSNMFLWLLSLQTQLGAEISPHTDATYAAQFLHPPGGLVPQVFSRLASLAGSGGWAPQRTDRNRWLQVDLRDRVEVTGVATQGRHGSSDWVTSYQLMVSDTGRAWKRYRLEDGVTTFPGNSDADGVVLHKLPHPVRTRYLRFVPLTWNPSGWVGLRIEAYGCSYKSDVADFDGRSSLLYRFNQKSMSTVKDVISLRFKSQKGEGVLVHGEGQRGDYITLELHQGRLALHLNLGEFLHSGSGHASVTLGSLLDDQHWHSVLIERFNKQVNFTLDRHTQHFRTRGDGDSLEVDYELSIGGIPLPGKPGTFLRKNFQGCMENLYYNGVNIIDLAKRRKPQIYSPVATTFLSSSSSFLSLTPEPRAESLSVHFQFRTWNRDGLLLFTQPGRGSEHLVLRLGGGQLRLTFHRSALQRSEISTGEAPPSVGVARLARSMKITSALRLSRVLISPGCPPSSGSPGCRNPTSAFQGCLRLLSINNQPVDLFQVQQGLLGNYSDLQFDICGIRDRYACLPNFCEHGGRCVQSWSTFHCDCSGTGYSGPTCHNSIYEPSCEAYRQAGSSSGFFSIDPDGSGPLKPTLVYCNMTEDKVWTVVSHNSTEPVHVRGSTLQRPHVMRFNYSASPEQLRALVATSEQCQQEVVYRCRKSRLFNTWDWSPLSWWVDSSGEKHTYWGGVLPGVQQCSCSLDENCIDMNYFCNCDADREANDTGVLSYKDHLPVREITIGDTNRTGSEAIYRIGPLHCYGDRFLWNAASFYQESSYLHFPTFQAELSADISFYFKTTAPSGVFLENMGVKDFFRMELSSPSTVAFTFDVGNGPVVLAAKSHVPLNDKQWHYVRAERHVKGASLQVDQLPLRYAEAPADGHLRLQLSSQLFVGRAQRGFLGCIRALTMNGITLDLEERAKMTPGVSSMCPGHCTGHGSLCHNRGRCIESNNGYACDCTHSAYGGPHCKTGVWLECPSSSKSRENVGFSFQTSQSPAMLLVTTTFHSQYMAIILAHNGSLQIWYHLNKEKRPDVFTPLPVTLADGLLHSVRIHREGRDIHIQVGTHAPAPSGTMAVDEEVLQAASQGFVGCLSSVQFNHVAPLKAALLNRGSSLVSMRGRLVESTCGSSADMTTSHSLSARHLLWHVYGEDFPFLRKPWVIAAVTLVLLCTAAVLLRYKYRHNGSYRTNEAKGTEFGRTSGTAPGTDPSARDAVDERGKEFFI